MGTKFSRSLIFKLFWRRGSLAALTSKLGCQGHQLERVSVFLLRGRIVNGFYTARELGVQYSDQRYNRIG